MVERRTRRDFDELSERRRQGMALLEEGISQSDVARELSVSRQTVSRWVSLKDEFPDREAWRRRRLGRPGAIADEQRATLVRRLVDSYVREFGRRGRSSPKRVRWTLARVAELIEAEFGVSYSLTQVRNILIGLVGHDECLLSKPSFWACAIELTYPEYAGKALVEDFEEGWVVSWKVVSELRLRLGA
ncbi:helix-turn-helix domain-containing protein [Burkholderia pseudomallei]|uniref:helix-turn-helix domain-containing protein n=2 Tax=Burkholderia pseudomallei TaxID=28450 RepID=UPI0009B24ECD|nr:helix-turn-helix domain-containing protein [Burkholderia pseudomallei]